MEKKVDSPPVWKVNRIQKIDTPPPGRFLKFLKFLPPANFLEFYEISNLWSIHPPNRNNEVQDFDNFSFYLNSLVSLCYDSANIGYESFNLNLKAVVLNIVQAIMSDLNSISAVALNKAAAHKSSTLLKKIIMPLISPQQQHQIPAESTPIDTSEPTVFDSDFKFQKFIVFLVDFIHIIYDKISDMPVALEQQRCVIASFLLNQLSNTLPKMSTLSNNITNNNNWLKKQLIFYYQLNYQLLKT